MRKFIQGGVACLALAFAGCSTVGTPFDPKRVADIKIGEHDKTHMLVWFGAPGQRTSLQSHPKGCVERWQWVYGRANLGGSQGHALVIDFDAAGKVCDREYSTTRR